jgi:membrane fusion protein, multidrug efflux system
VQLHRQPWSFAPFPKIIEPFGSISVDFAAGPFYLINRTNQFDLYTDRLMSLDDQPQASLGSATSRLAVVPARTPNHEAKPAIEQAAPVAEKPKSRRKQVVFGVIALALIGLGGSYGRDYWLDGRFMVATDDAYVQGNIAQVSAKIQGYVSEIPVAENQIVAAGDVVMQLDDGDYKIALELAKSKIATQTETLKRIEAQTSAAKASVLQAQAQRDAATAALRNAQLVDDRARSLVASNAMTQAQVDSADAALAQATANLAGAEAQITSAGANVAVVQAEYLETQSGMRALELAVQQAQRNLDLTLLRAPYAGTITHLTPQKGDLVSPGQILAAIVPTDQLYIEANYKETQLDGIRPGATAKIVVDGLPGQEFNGTVTSISPATGSMFSLLPAQNATGNFTKVVQRVPVRISLPADVLASGKVRAGLSVVIDIDSRTGADAK